MRGFCQWLVKRNTFSKQNLWQTKDNRIDIIVSIFFKNPQNKHFVDYVGENYTFQFSYLLFFASCHNLLFKLPAISFIIFSFQNVSRIFVRLIFFSFVKTNKNFTFRMLEYSVIRLHEEEWFFRNDSFFGMKLDLNYWELGFASWRKFWNATK